MISSRNKFYQLVIVRRKKAKTIHSARGGLSEILNILSALLWIISEVHAEYQGLTQEHLFQEHIFFLF